MEVAEKGDEFAGVKKWWENDGGGNGIFGVLECVGGFATIEPFFFSSLSLSLSLHFSWARPLIFVPAINQKVNYRCLTV